MLVIALVAAPALGQVTWDGSCGTNNWHTCCNVGELVDNNWDVDPAPQCPPFPGPNDEVDLNGADVFITVRPVEIRNLSNGSLTVTSSGRLNTTEFVNLGALTVFTNVTADGDIIINGPLFWRGTLAGPLGSRVGANGPIAIDMLFNANLDGRTLVANGPVSWTGSGDIGLSNGAVFENRVSLSTNRDERIAGNDGFFVNSAPFTKADSVGVTRVLPNVFFENTDQGLIDVSSGTLSLEVGGENSGAIRVSDGAAIVFAPPPAGFFNILEDTLVEGGGLVRLGEGSGRFTVAFGKRFGAQNVQINGPGPVQGGGYEFTNLTFIRGTLLNGVTTVDGECRIFGNIGRTLDGHVLNLRGTTTWDQGSFVDFQIVTGGILNNFGSFTIRNERNKRMRLVNGQFINQTGGRVDILTDLSFIVGPGVVQNLDTINIGPGASLVDFAAFVTPIEFEQLGILNLRSGVLNVRRGRAFEGQFNLSADTLLQFLSDTFAIQGGTQFSGAGLVFIGGSSVVDFQQNSTQIANVELAGIPGGTVTGTGDLIVASELNWSRGQMTGSGATITRSALNMTSTNAKVLSQRRLQHEGAGAWTEGNFVLNDGARFVVARNATFDISTPGNFAHTRGAAGVVEVLGTVNKTSPSALTFPSGVEFLNRGNDTFNIQSGDVVIRGGGQSSGTISIAGGSNLRIASGEYTLTGGRVEGDGFVRVEGGVLGIEGTPLVQNMELVSGGINGPGNLTVNELFAWSGGLVGGGNGTLTISQGADIDMTAGGAEKEIELYTVLNEGAGQISGNNRVLRLDRSTWNNAGSLELRDGASVQPDVQGGASLINSGVIEKTGDTGLPSSINVPFTNSGTVRVQPSTLAIGGGGSSTGAFHTEADARVVFSGSEFSLNAGTRFTGMGVAAVENGTVRVNGDVNAVRFSVEGTLTGPGSLDVADRFSWGSGTLSGAGAAIVRNFAFIIGSREKTLDQRRLLNFGTIDWEGPLTALNGGRIVNAGTFRMGVLIGSDSVFGGADGGVFVNESAGQMLKAGPETYVLDVIVNNSGRIDVREGVLRFAHTFTQTGGAVIVRGGRVEFDNPVTLQGGRIGGNSNAVIQRLTNAGGSVSPGESPGTFTLEGDYEQGPDGALEIELGGRTPGQQHDVFVVTGDAAVGGALEILLIDGFEPQVGDTFTVMTYGSHSGEFDEVIAPCGYEFAVHYNANDVTLEVTGVGVPTPGDLDGDCDIDLDDYKRVAPCIGGPSVEVPPQGCDPDDFIAADLDADFDVDIRDIREFCNRFAPS
ncbi:MAG: hypothetical protein C4547_04920 [Phycisphaerales bacterium]|nr:MAG: hypothetical protein C4547_04920 [Phycisphaerales bacterium]